MTNQGDSKKHLNVIIGPFYVNVAMIAARENGNTLHHHRLQRIWLDWRKPSEKPRDLEDHARTEASFPPSEHGGGGYDEGLRLDHCNRGQAGRSDIGPRLISVIHTKDHTLLSTSTSQNSDFVPSVTWYVMTLQYLLPEADREIYSLPYIIFVLIFQDSMIKSPVVTLRGHTSARYRDDTWSGKSFPGISVKVE